MILATRESNQKSGVDSAAFLNSLVALPRLLTIYPATHSRIEQHLSRLHGMVGEALSGTPEVALRIHDGDVFAGEDTLELPRSLAKRFTTLLRQRGLETLVLREGLERSELRELGELLAADPKVVAQRLDGEPMEHVGLVAFRRATTEAAPGEALGPVECDIVRVVEETLSRPGIADRARRIRELMAQRAAPAILEQGLLEKMIHRYLAVHKDLPTAIVERAVDSFLDSLSLLMEADDEGSQGALSMEQCVWDLLQQSFDAARARQEGEGEPAAAQPADIAYDRFDPQALEGWTALAWKALRTQIEEHRADSASFLIHCEVLANSTNASHYQARSRRVQKALQSGLYPADSVVAGIGHLRAALAGAHPEDGERFVRTLIPHTSDQSALVELLGSLEGVAWHDARELVRQLALRDDSFSLLGMLVRAPIPRVLRVEVVKALSDLAKARPETWLSLTREQPQILLDIDVLRELMARSAELLGPATREILLRGKPHARSKLIRNLTEIGGPCSLRLLVLGLQNGRGARDLALIEALGTFSKPLAVGALKEVVHRCNTTKSCMDEAESALRALRQAGTAEAREFLREVAARKVWGVSMYRADLRRLARRYVKNGRAA